MNDQPSISESSDLTVPEPGDPQELQQSAVQEPRSKISFFMFVVLTLIVTQLAIPVILQLGMMGALGAMMWDSGPPGAGATIIILIFWYFTFVAPILIYIRIINALYRLYKPYKSPEEKKKAGHKRMIVLLLSLVVDIQFIIFVIF